MSFKKILEPFESLERKGFDEDNITSALRNVVPKGKQELPTDLLSELMAFDFCEDYENKESGWGTYFGPMRVWNNQDGTSTESPSIQRVTSQMIQYWEERATKNINPILIARYSGLVWDFKQRITGNRPNIEIGKIYVKALIESAKGNYCKYEFNAYTKLKRALKLAISFNDPVLIESCKQTIIEFEQENAIDNKPGLWGYSFDLLVGNKKVNLTSEEEEKIIKDLEDKLEKLTSEDTENQKIDPWAAEVVAERLAVYYRKAQKNNDVRRVMLEVGKAYDKIIGDASAMQVSGWLDHLRKIYLKFNLKEEAENLLLKIRELGPKVASELKPISRKFSLPKKEIAEYISAMTEGEIQEVIFRIAVQYIPIKEQVKEQIFDLSKKAPLTFLMGHQLQDEKGRVIATIGSLEYDLEGHIVRQVSQNLSYSSIFLRKVFQELVDKKGLGKAQIIEFIKKTPIINKERFEIIERGLEAYFANDFLVAIHLIVPQIEDAIRNIVEFAGGNVLKPARGGGFHLRTFDEILRDDIIKRSLGVDFADYLRILFTD